MADNPTPPQEDIEKRIGQYVKLRDMKAEIAERHKKELGPINEALDMLNSLLLNEMQRLNVTSLKASTGTTSMSTKDSASCSDADALWTHVVTSGEWGLLDKKPNVVAVRDYIEKHGVPPPGVNWNSVVVANVRRA